MESMLPLDNHYKSSNVKAKIHQIVFHYAFSAFCLSLPIYIQLNSFFIIILAINYLLEGRFLAKWKIAYRHPISRLMAFFYFMYIITLLNTIHLSEGLFELEVKFTLLFLPLLVVDKRFTKVQVHYYLRLFIVACFLSSVYCLTYSMYMRYLNNHVNPLDWSLADWKYFSYTLADPLQFHPTYFSAFMNIAFFITVHLALISWNKFSYAKRIGVLLFSLYIFSFIAFLAARTPLIAGLIIIVVSILAFTIRRQAFLLGFIILFSLLAICFILYNRVPYLNEKITNQYGAVQRYQVWKASTEIIRQHWLLGVGAGDVEGELVKKYTSNQFQEGIQAKFDPHNQYLDIWLSIGIIGIIFLILVVANFCVINWKNHNYLAIACILYLLLCWTTEAMLETQKGVVLFVFVIAMFSFPQNHQSQNNY